MSDDIEETVHDPFPIVDSRDTYKRVDPELREQLDRIEEKLDRLLEE